VKRVLLAALLLAPLAGRGEDAPSDALASTAEAPPSMKGGLHVGWGYYEAAHLGLSYHVDDRAAFELFGGAGLSGSARTMALGGSFAHALGRPIWTMEWGWDLKAVYWTQSDPNYDWKNLSMVLGGYLAKEIDTQLWLRLDAGVALTGALDSSRKQDLNFAHPTRWNGSVCLDLVYRFRGS